MSRTNVLSTATVNYLELIANGKIYRVPPYQRDYAWTEEEWEDLWNDILDLLRQPESRHYMGALVVHGLSDREFTVIDGQQRLATIGVLSLAVIAKLHRMADREIDAERNRERARELRNRFIPNALEPVYHDAANAILDRNASRPRAVFACLRPVYVDDGTFENSFGVFAINPRERKRLLKQILCRLEEAAGGVARDPSLPR